MDRRRPFLGRCQALVPGTYLALTWHVPGTCLAPEPPGLGAPPFVSLVEPERYPGVRGDFGRSFKILRSLPADIYLAPHAREFGRWRKLQARARGDDPTAPFIDREGYRKAIDQAEAKFRRLLAEQRRGQSIERLD